MNSAKQVGDRFGQVMVAMDEERRRFNEAISKGAKVILKTALGDYVVTGVTYDHWYSTTARHSFCGCNDHSWALCMKQAGLDRHPLFSNYTA